MAAGKIRYFTGKPCSHGHIAERLCSNSMCVDCSKFHSRAYNRLNADKVAQKKKRYVIVNSEKIAEEKRAYREKNKEKISAGLKRWRQRNKAALAAKKKKWAQENPEKMRLWRAKWRERNRTSVAAWSLNRIARKKAAPGAFTAKDVDRIALQQKYRCAYCRVTLCRSKKSVDHIQALSAGGTNFPKNIQILWPTCNSSKGAKDAIDFARSTGRLL